MKTRIKIMLMTVLFGVSLLSNAASVGEVIGRVMEKEIMKPVAFAEIILENKMDKIEVKANEYGYYYAGHIPTGKYQIRVTFNNRTFIINQVRIYDNYMSKVDFMVSNDESLGPIVELNREEALFASISPAGINLTGNTYNQPTQSLGDVLSTQPGVDVIDGRLFIKGSDQVRFFIDGSPVMGTVNVGRSW